MIRIVSVSGSWALLGLCVCACIGFVASSHAADADGDVDRTGLGAATEQLRSLLPLTVHDGRLALDQESWTRAREAQTPEQRRADMAARLAKRMHIAANQVPANLVDNMLNSQSSHPAIEFFQTVIDEIGGGGMGGSTSQSGHSYTVTSESRNVDGALNIDSNTHQFELKFIEKSGSKRIIAVSDDKISGLTVRYACSAKQFGFVFVQAPGGPALLAGYHGAHTASLAGQNFLDLFHKDPQATIEYMLQPLIDAGVDLPFSPRHHAVMNVVANGFTPSTDPEIKKKVDALAKALEDDDQDVREKAQKELVSVFPKAIYDVTQLRDTAQDPEIKQRISAAIEAYPDLLLAREYVLIEKLQENRAYLLELLANENYHAGARARLTAIVGKDYGDAPDAWPK